MSTRLSLGRTSSRFRSTCPGCQFWCWIRCSRPVAHSSIAACFFFIDTATTEIYTLSLHDALPIWCSPSCGDERTASARRGLGVAAAGYPVRSEEHTSELQSPCISYAVFCLKKKKKMMIVKAKVLRDGELAEIPAAELVPGDVVSVEAGDIIPADGRVIRAATLEIAESALTGESL